MNPSTRQPNEVASHMEFSRAFFAASTSLIISVYLQVIICFTRASLVQE